MSDQHWSDAILQKPRPEAKTHGSNNVTDSASDTPVNPDDDARNSMVLGIVGTSLGALSLGLLSIVSLILGIIGLKKYGTATRNGQATAGLVLGIINVSLGGIGTLMSLYWAAFAFSATLAQG